MKGKKVNKALKLISVKFWEFAVKAIRKRS